ncbi:MAG: hypothetical protein SFZ02_18395 [bacterium]|nr:hypothetical protein [bacterium]
MPITVQFMEEERALLVTLVDPWTKIELERAFKEDQMYRDLFAEAHPGIAIDMICDVKNGNKTYSNVLYGRKSPSFSHITKGLAIAVGASPLVQRLMSVVIGTVQRKRTLYFADTIEEALTIIHKKREI